MSLTMLSFGGGQDSTAILHRLIDDPATMEVYAPDRRLLVVMADTGDEHPRTYKHVTKMGELCEEHKIPFHFLTSDQGYHSDKWPGLRQFYRRTNTVGSKAFYKSCTDNLKIKPIYSFLSQYLHAIVGGAKTGKYRGKQPLVDFAERCGKIQVLLGIAAGEEKRVAGNDDKSPKWMQLAIERVYPLIDWGWDRAACQKYLRDHGHDVPPPSNCMLCPFMNKVELLWLYRFYPKSYHDWVEIEQNKIDHYKDKTENNLGVWGKKLLPEILEEAIEEHGHMTNEELEEHKMSHGHCVASRY